VFFEIGGEKKGGRKRCVANTIFLYGVRKKKKEKKKKIFLKQKTPYPLKSWVETALFRTTKNL